MAEALKPSIEITGKQNVNPSINRITEATAEDFQEIGEILIDHANKINAIARTDEEAEYYGVHSTLAGAQAAFPTAPNGSWAVIDPGNGNPKNIATVVNGVWEVNQLIAPILIFNTKLDRPDPGVGEIIYVVKDEKIFSLWYDGKYNDFGKDGANGLSAYQVAVAFTGFQGTEAQWIESIKGKDNYQLWLDAGNVGTYEDFFEASRGPQGIPGSPGPSGGGTAPIAYPTMADLYAGQSNQVLNGNYRVDDASLHPDVNSGRAWFDYNGGTTGTKDDYILKSEEESLNLDAQLTAIENRLTAVENGKADTLLSNLQQLNQAESDAVKAKLLITGGSDFTSLSFSSIISWNLDNKYSPKAKVDATGNFSLNLSNNKSGSNGFLKVLKSATSDLIITLDTNFQHHEKKGQGVISSITLSGISGSEFILEFINDGTFFYWDTLLSGGNEIATNSIVYNKIQKVSALSLLGNSKSLEADAEEVIMKPRVVGSVSGSWEDGISTVEGIDGQVSFDGTYLYFCQSTNKWFRVEKARLTNTYNIFSQVAINLKDHSKVTANLTLKVNYSLDYSAAVEGGEYLFILTQDSTARTVTFAASKWKKGSSVTIPTQFPTATSGAVDIVSCRYINGKMLITSISSNVTDI